MADRNTSAMYTTDTVNVCRVCVVLAGPSCSAVHTPTDLQQQWCICVHKVPLQAQPTPKYHVQCWPFQRGCRDPQ
jgi:hypothetical protein